MKLKAFSIIRLTIMTSPTTWLWLAVQLSGLPCNEPAPRPCNSELQSLKIFLYWYTLYTDWSWSPFVTAIQRIQRYEWIYQVKLLTSTAVAVQCTEFDEWRKTNLRWLEQWVMGKLSCKTWHKLQLADVDLPQLRDDLEGTARDDQIHQDMQDIRRELNPRTSYWWYAFIFYKAWLYFYWIGAWLLVAWTKHYHTLDRMIGGLCSLCSHRSEIL